MIKDKILSAWDKIITLRSPIKEVTKDKITAYIPGTSIRVGFNIVFTRCNIDYYVTYNNTMLSITREEYKQYSKRIQDLYSSQENPSGNEILKSIDEFLNR